MHPIRLISEIYKNKWFIEPLYALQHGPLVATLLNGNIMAGEQPSDENDNNIKCFAIDAKTPTARFKYDNGWENAPYGSIAVIPVNGALMKEDQDCGPSGMATIGRMIQQADEHPNIKAIVLRIDSPGGTVDGTETLGSIIKSVEKPILSFVDGMMASAALWIGSSADEVWASTDMDEVGSVGVILNFGDVQPYWEKQGIVFHTIKASTSPDKNKMWDEIQAGKYDAYIKEVLDPFDEKFMDTMRANRPAVKDQHLTGKLYFARDVMGAFVDSIGTFEQAIERAAQLADEKTAINNNNHNSKSMKQFTKLNAVLGVESLESLDDSVNINEQQLEMIEAVIGDTSAVDALAAERDEAISGRDTATGERDSAIAERDTARTELSNAITAFDSIDATIASAQTPEAKAQAIRTLLAAKPGAAPAGTLDTSDPVAEEFDGFTAEEKEISKNI